MLAGAGGFALKVGFKGWIFFCPGLYWDVLLLSAFSVALSACSWCQRWFGVGMWHPAHSGTVPPLHHHCSGSAQDPFLLSQGNVELNRWSLTQHTKQLQPLSSDCRMPHER